MPVFLHFEGWTMVPQLRCGWPIGVYVCVCVREGALMPILSFYLKKEKKINYLYRAPHIKGTIFNIFSNATTALCMS